MAQFFKEANKCKNKIEHFYKHGRSSAYIRAKPYFNKMAELMHKAQQTGKNQGDAPLIKVLYDQLKPKMDEMRERQEKYQSENL
jgi:Cu/Zn superoxide dismutase